MQKKPIDRELKENADTRGIRWVGVRDIGFPEAHEIAPGHYNVHNMMGSVSFVVTDDGIVVIDSGNNEATGEALVGLIRTVSDKPIKYLIYTHGHFDHVKGAPAFKKEGAVIIAQRNVSRRFRRYTKFSGYHARINAVQFADDGNVSTADQWSSFIYPDVEYTDSYSLTLGGKTFALTHGYGETDDATVVAVPEDGIWYIGDFSIFSFPNIGNPQKVLRYDHEWFEMLDSIAAQNPKVVVPGHGPAVFGADALQLLRDTSDALKLLYEESVRYINEGRDLDYILAHVKLPENLANSPYIQPNYGTPEFVLRGIYRRYTGWYDGNPSNLNPAPKAEVSAITFELIGSREKIIRKARSLVGGGNPRLALAVLDLALGGDADDQEALLLKADILERLSDASGNLFYANFYHGAAEKLRRQGNGRV